MSHARAACLAKTVEIRHIAVVMWLTAINTFYWLLMSIMIILSVGIYQLLDKSRDWSSSRSAAKASGWLQSAVTTTYVMVFIVDCGIARFLCAMRVFEVRASSSSLRLPLCGLHCWAIPRRKWLYSITHSITHTAYLMPREPKLSLRNINSQYYIDIHCVPKNVHLFIFQITLSKINRF